MIADDLIRLVCTMVIAETDTERLEQMRVGLKMLCTQYVGERSSFLIHSNFSRLTKQSRSKSKRVNVGNDGPNSKAA